MSEVLADVELPMVSAVVEQRISDGNGGPAVAYRLVINGGRAHVVPVSPEAEPAGGPRPPSRAPEASAYGDPIRRQLADLPVQCTGHQPAGNAQDASSRDDAGRPANGPAGDAHSADASRGGHCDTPAKHECGSSAVIAAGGHGGECSSGHGVVVMSQSRKIADAVRRGELAALAALQAGLIKVSGDVRVLIAASEALELVNAALGRALADDESRLSTGSAGDVDSNIPRTRQHASEVTDEQDGGHGSRAGLNSRDRTHSDMPDADSFATHSNHPHTAGAISKRDSASGSAGGGAGSVHN